MFFRAPLARMFHVVESRVKGFPFASQLKFLQDLAEMDAGEIQEAQWRRLEERLGHWTSCLPFYRDHLESRARELGRSMEALLREMVADRHLDHLPLMDKATFMANSGALCLADADRTLLRRNHTGGSTGEVFYFLQNHVDARWSQASRFFCLELMGRRPGSPTAKIWGSPIESSTADTWKDRVSCWLQNQAFHSTYYLTPDRITRIVKALDRQQPEIILGYPTSLSAFVPEMRRQGLRLRRAKAIWSASETLFPAVRQELEEAFGCPAFNLYGSREFGYLAQECTAHQGLHLFEGRYYFEFLPEGEGLHSLVVTDLWNEAQPLIRYRIGDVVRRTDESCACGRGLALIKHVEGRTFELIHGQDGEVVTGTFWTLLLRTRPGIRQFQVLQQEIDLFEIRLVVDDDFQRGHCDHFASLIQGQFQRKVRILWTFHDHLDNLPSGKFRFIVALKDAQQPYREPGQAEAEIAPSGHLAAGHAERKPPWN